MYSENTFIAIPYFKLTHTRSMALFLGLPGWAGTRKVKPIWILIKQETVSSSGISWAICKSAPRSRQITSPTPHHSVFYRPDALPAAQPTASKHWRQLLQTNTLFNILWNILRALRTGLNIAMTPWTKSDVFRTMSFFLQCKKPLHHSSLSCQKQ